MDSTTVVSSTAQEVHPKDHFWEINVGGQGTCARISGSHVPWSMHITSSFLFYKHCGLRPENLGHTLASVRLETKGFPGLLYLDVGKVIRWSSSSMISIVFSPAAAFKSEIRGRIIDRQHVELLRLMLGTAKGFRP